MTSSMKPGRPTASRWSVPLALHFAWVSQARQWSNWPYQTRFC